MPMIKLERNAISEAKKECEGDARAEISYRFLERKMKDFTPTAEGHGFGPDSLRSGCRATSGKER